MFLRLGFALWVLVGLLYMLSADRMPLTVRLPHALEIFADEFVYTGALVWLTGTVSAAARLSPTLSPVHLGTN